MSESSKHRQLGSKKEDRSKLGFNFKSKTGGKINFKKGNLEAFKAEKAKANTVAPISIKLATPAAKKTEEKVLKKPAKVAAIFNDDSDSDPEEMPLEAKMRMKNVGRDTPTSSGPNSFNKGKHGFTDCQSLWNKQQEELARKLREEDNKS